MPQLGVLVFGSLIVGAASVTADPATALPASAAPELRAASQMVSPVQKAACLRFGWRGWGWYPYCGPPPLAWA